MYSTVRGIPGISSGAEPVPGPGRRRVGRIVITLGLVSFFTDLSSEMVVAVLPVYLTLVLGLTPIQYGLIDGLYQGVTAAVRIVGGIAADLTRRPKAVAVVGYGLSCVCKLFFLPAHSFFAVTAVLAVDRTGKGLRSAPRDAMIADSAEPASLGYSFGVHRAMDTAGALGGPLIAFGILALLADAYDAIFVLSFSLAAIGVAILVLFVPGRLRSVRAAAPGPEGATASASAATGFEASGTGSPVVGTGSQAVEADSRGAAAGSHAVGAGSESAAAEADEPANRKGALRRTLREFTGLTKGSAYRRLLGVGALLSLTTISDGFVYLTMKERVGIGAAMFPLLFVGTAAIYLVLAIPFGRLADRVGRGRVFLGGHALAVFGYLALWLLPPGPVLVAAVLALVGAYYAATDGVLPALTAPLVPDRVRASGIAGIQTVMAVGSLASAALFGVIWSQFGRQSAVAVFAAGLAVAIVLAVRLLANLPAGPDLPVEQRVPPVPDQRSQ
jgi:MFS family permease